MAGERSAGSHITRMAGWCGEARRIYSQTHAGGPGDKLDLRNTEGPNAFAGRGHLFGAGIGAP